MTLSEGNGIRGSGTSRIDIRVVRDPIAFIAQEHLRQRSICAGLDVLARQDQPDLALTEAILRHTRDELPVHVLDEEEDFFPLLRRRAAPEDEIEKTLSRLADDHARGEELAAQTVEVLEGLIAGASPLTETDSAILTSYAAHERLHLIVENAIILPIARARLTKADRETLAKRMAARRGLSLDPEDPDA